MSRFPSESDLLRVHARVAMLLGQTEGLENPRMLRAIILGVRMGRSEKGVRADAFSRAAALLHQIVSLRPFVAANGATALAAALLYLSRHGHHAEFGEGQAVSLVHGVREGTMDQDRIASMFRVMVGITAPTGRPTSRSTV